MLLGGGGRDIITLGNGLMTTGYKPSLKWNTADTTTHYGITMSEEKLIKPVTAIIIHQ